MTWSRLNPVKSLLVISAVATLSLCPTFARQANAACASPSSSAARVAPKMSFSPVTAAIGTTDSGSFAGMWHVVFLIGDGPDRYDETLQTVHTDGTELMISNGVPPLLGNVCIGIWQQTGRTIRVLHMTWNWDAESHFAGRFELRTTLTVDRQGSTYSGRWTADSYDPDGVLIPELHAEGTVRAERIEIR